ncbi:uncharacterized protein LOC124938096 [Impatiens glandulifera]|uniref:uncharacterized protein LOC124938096 n=1 Tax=Impatiens glandulifera TaxID=253017 RepID=UPI001FB0A893|nr:uncharacterized protein LOC124938096 [Impatiens glandulifera]XP_047334426.1 uncharacterized protein LOC124938096 [Impatiens glandulifera]
MATPDVLIREHDLLSSSPLFDLPKGDKAKSRGYAIEQKIEQLENLAGNVRNRRSRRWLNDRLLMELVPRLNAEEIRGLFAPPPWGDEVPPSSFSMTNGEEWDRFRHTDMDKEAITIKAFESSISKKNGQMDSDKMAVLNAWHRVGVRTREALRRSFQSDSLKVYEEKVRTFVTDDNDGDGDVLVMNVQDPFQRLLLHGVCEFYNVVSMTTTESKEGKDGLKMTRIKKKKVNRAEVPNISLCEFLKMAKGGFGEIPSRVDYI